MSNEVERSADRREVTPKPTYAPVAMAMGITLAAWGILTHWVMSLSGVGLFAWALWNWMVEICDQWGRRDEQ